MLARFTTAAAIAALTLAFATQNSLVGTEPAFAQGRSDSAPGRGGDGPPGRSDSGPPGQSDSASAASDDGSPGRSGSAPGRGGDGPPGQSGRGSDGSPGGESPGGESPGGGSPGGESPGGGGDPSNGGAAPGDGGGPASPSPSGPPADTTPTTPDPGPAPGGSAPAAPPSAPPASAPPAATPPPSVASPSPVPAAPPTAVRPRDPQTVGSIPGGGGRGGPDLPAQFLPGRDAGRAAPPARLAPLRAAPGVDEPVVRVCWSALAAAAQPFGAVYVEAASAGGARRARNGEIEVPLRARVLYGPQQGNAVRESRVTCRLDGAGRVSGLR